MEILAFEEKHRTQKRRQITICKIIDDVKSQGYSCQTNFEEEIPGLQRLYLPLRGTMISKDGTNYVYQRGSYLMHQQNLWVTALGFRHEGNESDPWGEESEGDVESLPSEGYWKFKRPGSLDVVIYFLPKECLPEGTEFYLLQMGGAIKAKTINGR